MTRKIRLRAWGINSKQMYSHEELLDETRIDPRALYDCLMADGKGYDTETVLLQFTGLLDKNGVEIYEGDIYRQWTTYKGIESVLGNGKKGDEYREGRWTVKWRKDHCAFDIHKPLKGNSMEVIGNIYQNKDLIEEEK